MEQNDYSSRYDLALQKYNMHIHDSDVQNFTAKLLGEHLSENDNADVRRMLLNCLDLTSLNITDTEEAVLSLVEKVNRDYAADSDYGAPATICVYPSMVSIVKASLEVDRTQIASVSGGFPHAQTFSEVKVAETMLCLKDGAAEIDMVMKVGKFLIGDFEDVCDDIEELRSLTEGLTLKVILETGALESSSNIKKAAILAMYSGADFIKTSTGKLKPAATPEAAVVMCTAIAEYYKETGRQVGFKAAGGVRTVADAMKYYTIVKELLGGEWLKPDLFRIGASGLYDELMDSK